MSATAASADLVPLSAFESVTVPGRPTTKISIKKFVQSKRLKFAPGAGFYELSKPETIQLNKRVLVQRLSEPAMLVTGSAVKDILGIDEKSSRSGKYAVEQMILDEFRIYVQSTSYNRNLFGGSSFLYQKEGVDPFVSPAPESDTSTPTTRRTTKRGAPAAAPTAPPASSAVAASHLAPPAAPAPAPKKSRAGTDKIEIVFSFDTTGSMYPCLSTVRSVLGSTLRRLASQIPGIRIGLVAHGDYCDKDLYYLMKGANNYKFCGADEVGKLVDFANNAGQTGGGDWPEAYELVLREVGTRFDWSPDANKSLVLIGDAVPHAAAETPDKIDWRSEAAALKGRGIRVYAVQALDNSESEYFYRELAQLTLGFHLRLHQFSSIVDFMTALCYHEGDTAAGLEMGQEGGQLSAFETELSASGRMVRNLRQLFDQLQGRAPSAATTTTAEGSSSLIPVSPSRFQVLLVYKDMPIKQFAESRGLIFKAGRGFYEFTKPEAVSDKKEVILMDKTTGDFYTGWEAAREFAGIEPGKTGKQSPKGGDQYCVFVQSTSYNRKLIGGQKFLYEVDSDR